MKLVVSLDAPTYEANISLVDQILAQNDLTDILFKVGLNSYIGFGPQLLDYLAKLLPYRCVVLDLKLHDIESTMLNAVEKICQLPMVEIFTFHASVGANTMGKISTQLSCKKNPPKSFAVTVLTSFDSVKCQAIYKNDIKNTVGNFSRSIVINNIDGIICSVSDLQYVIRQKGYGYPVIEIMTPGIELFPREDDQARKGSLDQAVRNNVDYIVIGRQIYNSPNPGEMVEKIFAKIRKIKNLLDQFEKESSW